MPTLIGTRVDDESTEPRVEPIQVPKARQLSPRVEEGILDGVFRTLPVPKDEGRDREEAVACGRRESLEGLEIAALRRFHDIALHRLLHRLRDRTVALSPYDAGQARTVQEMARGRRPGR